MAAADANFAFHLSFEQRRGQSVLVGNFPSHCPIALVACYGGSAGPFTLSRRCAKRVVAATIFRREHFQRNWVSLDVAADKNFAYFICAESHGHFASQWLGIQPTM